MFKKRRKKEICLLDDDCFLGKNENRKGAAKPRPLCTPLGLFLGVLGCGGVRLLTCVCMLRCWMCEVEPMYVDADGEARCCRLVERV